MKSLTREFVQYINMPTGSFQNVVIELQSALNKIARANPKLIDLTVEVENARIAIYGTSIESDEAYLERLELNHKYLTEIGVSAKDIYDRDYAEFLRLKAIFEPEETNKKLPSFW